MPVVDETRIRAFETPAAFNDWLREHHATESELWLKIYKKASGKPTVNWGDAVLEALCWGWIDGIKKSYGDEAYLQRLTPRKRKSNWSKRNRENVEKLIAEGRMQEPGMVHVRAAQADGRWEAAYPPQSEMKMPEDFLQALESNPAAKAFFDTLNKSNRFAIAVQLHSAKKPETRQRRFTKLMQMLENQEKPT